MTQSVQQVLTAFDALTDAEKHVAAVEVLRRSWPTADSGLPESALLEAADALFLELDAREAVDAKY